MSSSTLPTPRETDRASVLRPLFGLLLVLFVAMISSTVVSVALPKIIGSLNGSQTQYTWVVTATLLVATASTPIWGKLADLYDKKTLVQIAIGIFLVGSLLSGFAQDAGQLIAARAFQGLGVGGLQALVQTIIAAMIPPKDRGRYNGLLGAVMAVATVSGPLLGGVITETSWLGWRWCFFVGIPFAVVALGVLQRSLHLPAVRGRAEVQVDYVGAALLATGVSALLIWVSFVDSSFAWLSWQTAAMVGPSVLILGIAVWWESRVAEPVLPLSVIKQKGPALAILASLAVGMAMFGGAVFLGQYFQVSRGYNPTEAGLLMIPMMLGTLVSSTVSGQIVSRTGKLKAQIVAGTVVLVAGFGVLSTLDRDTPLLVVFAGLAAVGVGVGMSMQNLVLAVQNTVSLRDVGAASASITFFRSLGGTIGISVLGAVLANRVNDSVAEGLREAGVPASASGGTSNLNLEALPEPIRGIVELAYGDATGHIFLLSTAIAVVGVVAALLLKPAPLRTTLDVEPAEKDDARS
ncbi:MDR family MFS transporter [Saccharomonospora cyanea]|uniref:Arabinose efflux permease family protein n=1 Tax=Saccharomonospora cyanea NA-134 TaxID=882082 RepID=H5XLT8_9PSEU|nr:MDR family MFS transporter [Saccharomonospora cyanea]EHR61980.1 arabinose efflux permease family protein [Saccharomonospora cyanea NA-134]